MSRAPGRYEFTPQGDRAFIPNPLPPQLSLPPTVERKVEDATHLLGQVESYRRLLPNIVDLLVYSSLRREALASSTIENTIASPEELIRYQASQQLGPTAGSENVREVSNYSVALEWGYAQLPSLPISSRLMLGLHEHLMSGVRGAGTAGRFKQFQNYISSHGQIVFVPPPPQAMQELITALERYVNNPDRAETRVVQVALAHYQFETIHPFGDGNGRVGRLLIILHLIQLGLLSAPLIYPSVYFEHHRDEYYHHLQSVRENGAWAEWIDYFAQGIKEQCQATIQLAEALLRLREHLQSEISSLRGRASRMAALDSFFRQPVLSVKEVATQAGMSVGAAQAAVEDLERLGVVSEITGRQKRRVYACDAVLRAIFGVDIRSSRQEQVGSVGGEHENVY